MNPSQRTPDPPERGASTSLRHPRPFGIVTELGEGGMARVHLAAAQGPGGVRKLVVLKSLRAHLASEPACVEMFLHEARLATRLNHPNVVQTFEVTESEGRQVMVMEYLEGQALSQLSARARRRGRLSLPLYLQVLCGALAGLHYAHELKDYDGTSLGLVHRDVSPQNIFVTYDGQVKLLDFGIAKAAVNAASHTETGVLKGKVRYMAAEQINGEPVDRRADIFAMGVVLWEILAGERIWLGVPDMALMQRVTKGDIPSPRTVNADIPDVLERICLRAMSLERDDRYATAEELQLAIEQAVSALGAAVKPRDLGAHVAELFADDRASIQETIEAYIGSAGKRGAGADETVRPTPAPDATLSAATAEPDASRARESRNAARWVVAAVFGSVACALILWIRWARESAAETVQPAAAAEAPPSAPPPETAPSAAPVPGQVRVRVSARATPTTAHLLLDGKDLPSNPYEGVLAGDAVAHELLCEAPGYVSQRVAVSLDRDVNVAIALERERLRVPRSQGTSGRGVGAAGPAPVAPAASAAAAPNCAQPYYFDDQGIKKIRSECL